MIHCCCRFIKVSLLEIVNQKLRIFFNLVSLNLKLQMDSSNEAVEAVLQDYVSSEDLRKFELVYHANLQNGQVSRKEQFDYAWCLIRSKYPADIRKGVVLLEDLFQSGEAMEKRDYMYYLAIGHTKLKDYNKALKLLSKFLSIEPTNRQAQHLQSYVKSKMRKEGLMGMAIVGGAALAIGGAVTLGMALAKNMKNAKKNECP